jgi:hypothetical protein
MFLPKKLQIIICFLFFWNYFCISQVPVPTFLKQISEEEIEQSKIVHGGTGSLNNGKVTACVTAANNNFANAQSLTVNGGTVAGTTCGSLESGETTGCNTGITSSVWYSFVATSTTHYVQIALTSGSCYFGSAVYGTTSLPTTACSDKPISCQSASSGPATQLYQLTNLIVGNTYYIQVVYGGGGPCGTNNAFSIQVTTANPGGVVTNPGYINQCATSQPGCYFLSPPSTAQVTTGCTSYPLASAGYSANSVMTIFQTFTNSPTASNVSWQAIITSNCIGGNVVWLDWSLYSCSCGLLTCGDINNLTMTGLLCSGCYIIEYQFELANCASFTTIWPYQNVPATPIPCSPLPIQLLYYVAKTENNKVTLEWATASESNAKEFLIERSNDAVNFTPIGKKAAFGNSSSIQKYSIADDASLKDGTYYYRMSETGADGMEVFSKTLLVNIEKGNETIRLYPNPASSYLDLVFSEEYQKSETVLEVFDATGQKVKTESFNPQGILRTVDIHELPAGIYQIKISIPDRSKTIFGKIIKE